MAGKETVVELEKCPIRYDGYVSSAAGKILSLVWYWWSAVAVSKSWGRADLRRINRDALGFPIS